jgi:hypothetical protein
MGHKRRSCASSVAAARALWSRSAAEAAAEDWVQAAQCVQLEFMGVPGATSRSIEHGSQSETADGMDVERIRLPGARCDTEGPAGTGDGPPKLVELVGVIGCSDRGEGRHVGISSCLAAF